MNIKRGIIIAVASALVICSGGVLLKAQQARGALEQRFRKLDTNNDGQLTPAEVPAALFSQLDLDGDGSVRLPEALRAVAKMGRATGSSGEAASALATRLFERFDADGDKAISRQEAGDASWFDRLDRDRDGSVSLKETLAAAEQIKSMVQQEGEPAGPVPPAQAVADGPLVLKPGDLGVGRQVANVRFTDLAGIEHDLNQRTADGAGVVLAFTSSTCPISKRYLPSLLRLAGELKTEGISLVLVNPFPSESNEALHALVKEQSIRVPYVHDKDQALAQALQARSTTEVFFIDDTRTLIYRGALDDQYGLHYNRDAPTRSFLTEAVADHLAGRLPHIAATEAPGCELDLKEDAPLAKTEVTYHRDIARILQQNCVECHREGGLAPFSLTEPDEVMDHPSSRGEWHHAAVVCQAPSRSQCLTLDE
jgi:Ca2+-binding EF-hand superfamily protein